MAEESDKFTWLLTEETIGHHERAKKCQLLIQELMWERGRIELSYIQSLEKWAEALSQGIKGEDSPYPRHVQRVLTLPVREAQAQANQHQLLYNDILRADGPCLQMRELLQSIEETTMVSESKRVYSTAVSQYQALVQRRQELEGEVRRRKQHYEYSMLASRDMDDKLDGRRRRKTKRPLSARKMETMESRQYYLKKYTDVQLSQLQEQELELENFLKDQRKPLESILSDLNLFSRRRLSDTIGLTKAYLHSLAQHELDDKREKKRLTLMDCEKVLRSESMTSLADQMISSVREKVKQIVLAQNATRFTLEDMASCDNKQSVLSPGSGGPSTRPSPGGPDTRFRPSAPSPECHQNRLRDDMSEGELPLPPPTQHGRSQIARVSHLLSQSHQDELYISQPGRRQDDDILPSSSTGTMHVFYTSSNDSLIAKAGSEQPTASNSIGSEASLETLVIPPERKTLPREQLPFGVRDFCIQEEDDEEEADQPHTSDSRFASIRREICKKLLGRESSSEPGVILTEVVELIPGSLLMDQKDENVSLTGTVDTSQSHSSLVSGPQSTVSSASNSYINDCDDVAMMKNVRVRALHHYQGRNDQELCLEQGQIVKQKLAADEDGYSYGWTRSHKLGAKRYGKYPSGVVELLPLYSDRVRKYEPVQPEFVPRENGRRSIEPVSREMGEKSVEPVQRENGQRSIALLF